MKPPAYELEPRLDAAAPALLLAAAVLLGGLRAPILQAAFAALLLFWRLGSRGAFSFGTAPAAALYFAWLLPAALFSPEPGVSLAALGKYWLPAAVFFAALSSREGEKHWHGALLAIGALGAAWFLGEKALGRVPFGLIGKNPNYTGAFCAAALPTALLWAGGTERRLRLPGALLALLLGGGLLASGSRGTLAAGLAASSAALLLAGRRRTLLALLAGALAALAFLPGDFWNWLLKLWDPRGLQRPNLWLSGLRAAAESPLLGGGPGLFGALFEQHKFAFFDGAARFGHYSPHAHGEIFNLAAEAGFPAALLFLAAAYAGLRRGTARSLPLAAAAFAVLLQGLVDITFYSGAVALLYWGSLGFAASGDGQAAPAGRAPALLPAAALLALLAGPLLSASASSAAYRGLASGFAESSPALRLALARRAAAYAPGNAFLHRGAGQAAAAAGDYEAARGYFEAALALEPLYAGARLDLARLYAAAGLPGECRRHLGMLRETPPPPRANRYQLDLIYLDRGAAAALEKGPCRKR